uniref:Uncharacterized protein n=2 Tax=Lutzomyia longipalpis TaxID=7200 RepID=A0A1B0C8M3_LUTLO
ALAIVCIGLLDDPANNTHYRTFVTQRTIALCYATFGAYIIISGAYLLGKVFQDTIMCRCFITIDALAIVCIGLLDDPANNTHYRTFVTQRTIALCYATFGAYIIISGAYLLGKVFQDTMTWKTAALLNFIGAILFVACGAALLRDWSETKNRNYWHPNTQRMDLLCAAGSVAVVAAVVFLVDLLATLRQGVRGYLE